jgi:hypothetical protein
VFSLYSLYAKFRNHSPQGFTALILAMTFFRGQSFLFFFGIIGEYAGRVYEEAKGRPHYVVFKIVRRNSNMAENNGIPQAEGAVRP